MWEFATRYRDKRALTLKQPLYGHTEPVTCLAASSTYNVIISGSRDRTCIIWDLSRLVFVRQLRGHAAPVAAVCINELTVSVMSQSCYFLGIILHFHLERFQQNCALAPYTYFNEMLTVHGRQKCVQKKVGIHTHGTL